MLSVVLVAWGGGRKKGKFFAFLLSSLVSFGPWKKEEKKRTTYPHLLSSSSK